MTATDPFAPPFSRLAAHLAAGRPPSLRTLPAAAAARVQLMLQDHGTGHVLVSAGGRALLLTAGPPPDALAEHAATAEVSPRPDGWPAALAAVGRAIVGAELCSISGSWAELCGREPGVAAAYNDVSEFGKLVPAGFVK